jgi:imidazolonepropionase-like amidohydrolase
MKAITNATLIDGNGGDPVSGATMVIGDDGRIERVGAGLQPPTGVTVMDVDGRTIMPGLIDCHVHFMIDLEPMHDLAQMPLSLKILRAADNARKTLDAGVTSVRDAGGSPLGLKLAAEQGLIPAPRMKIAVSILSQTGGHGDFLLPSGVHFPMGMPHEGNLPEWPAPVCDGVDEVRKTVRATLRAGADVIKLCASGGVLSPSDEPTSTQFSPEEIRVMVYEAAAEGKTCMAHAQSTQGILNAVEAGVESIEHGVYMDESVVAEMKRRGTFLVPTLLPAETIFDLAREKPGAVLPQSLRKAEEVFPHHRASFRMAVEAGVRIAMGTDAAVCPHGDNARELGLMVDGGMTPMQALVASTKTASECIHTAADVGTLEPGKLADLLVVDGDPLSDVGVLADKNRLLVIMQGGRAHKDLVS